MDVYLYLTAPPYLADFIHYIYGNPAFLPKYSVERNIIHKYVRRLQKDEKPDIGTGANVRILMPCFSDKDPRTYNALSPKAKQYLIKSFLEQFDVFLYRKIIQPKVFSKITLNEHIYLFMEKYGIEDNESNWCAISQRVYRLKKKLSSNNILM
ncbi:MAG: hypothetical protein LBF79_05640 [Dysgonamonadaceae bacterium]|jgi:hypothetical protein|nr:hypothetical protein [Dysgonamonadaceae bacterium]